MADIALPYFLARPAGNGPAPGVVVIQEANGVTPQLLRVCQRLAGEGYMAIAPDLFFRLGGSEAAPYTELVPKLVPAEVEDDLTGAAAVLRGLGATKVGITGFCMGGKLTYRMAVTTNDFDAGVGFYGSGIPDEFGTPNCPIQLFFGGKDPWIPGEQIDRVAARHPDETRVYPEAGHGFMRDRSEDYHEESATDAWQRLLSFFGQHLK
jgi:carboxymethylenebutenolidase